MESTISIFQRYERHNNPGVIILTSFFLLLSSQKKIHKQIIYLTDGKI